MFAPQTIQIRYGDNGALATGAAAAGGSEAYGRQKAMDMQFINAESDRRQQANEFAAQQDSQRLQLAQELALHRINGSPTSYASTRAGSPMTAAIQQTKQLAYASGTAGLSLPADQDAILKTLANDPTVSADDYSQIVNETAKRQQHLSSKESDKTAKQQYLKTLPPEVAGRLAPLADSEDIDLPKLRIAASDILDRETVKPGAKLSYEVSNIDAQSAAIRERLRQIADQMEKGGINPEQAPAEFNPTNSAPEAGPTNWMGKPKMTNGDFWRDAGHMFTGGAYTPNFVSGGNPEALKQMKLYYGLKQQLDQLQAQREQTITAASQQVSTPVAKGSKQITPAIAAHFMQQAGNDRTKARSLALAEGYSF